MNVRRRRIIVRAFTFFGQLAGRAHAAIWLSRNEPDERNEGTGRTTPASGALIESLSAHILNAVRLSRRAKGGETIGRSRRRYKLSVGQPPRQPSRQLAARGSGSFGLGFVHVRASLCSGRRFVATSTESYVTRRLCSYLSIHLFVSSSVRPLVRLSIWFLRDERWLALSCAHCDSRARQKHNQVKRRARRASRPAGGRTEGFAAAFVFRSINLGPKPLDWLAMLLLELKLGACTKLTSKALSQTTCLAATAPLDSVTENSPPAERQSHPQLRANGQASACLDWAASLLTDWPSRTNKQILQAPGRFYHASGPLLPEIGPDLISGRISCRRRRRRGDSAKINPTPRRKLPLSLWLILLLMLFSSRGLANLSDDFSANARAFHVISR